MKITILKIPKISVDKQLVEFSRSNNKFTVTANKNK